MSEKAKDTVYTPEVVESMIARYKAAEDQDARDSVVETVATEVGKTVASVRAKLVREGVYIKKERTAKDGSKIVTKDEMVTALEEKLGLPVGSLDSLEKATKRVIKVLDAHTCPQ